MGCTYFRAHAAAFEFASPVTLYHSITAISVYEKHDKWLHSIRKTIWLRADTESRNMPSTTALRLHWLRCLWIIGMWHKSTENDIDMPGVAPTHTCTCNVHQRCAKHFNLLEVLLQLQMKTGAIPISREPIIHI